MARKAPSRVYPAPVTFQAGPFVGVTDSAIPPAANQSRAYRAVNCYVSRDLGFPLMVSRPGFTQMGSAFAGGADVQWIGQFTKTNGTEYTVAVAGGEIYTYDHGGGSWTKQVSTANLTTASITVSSTARFYAVPFFDTLVFSEGTNVPFTWDGSAGAGGLVELTNAPVAYGQPVVYYSKLFFIKNTERDTIVWSEEAAANTGYEAGGYTNAWSLPGTKGEPIVALAARNDSLGVIRTRSTTLIQGAVNDAFTTTGTRSAVSERIGTSSPGGVLVLDEGTVIVDSDGRPQFWPQGAGYAEGPAMWNDCATTISTIPRSTLSVVQTLYEPLTNTIRIGMADAGSSQQVQWLIFERTGGLPNYIGLFNGFTANAAGIVKTDASVPRFAHGTDAGVTYLHGTPTGGPWTDGLSTGSVAIGHELVGPALGYDTDEECRFDEATFTFFARTDMNDVSVGYETTRGTNTTDLTFDITGAGFFLDVDTLDVDSLVEGSGEKRRRVGWKARGRWCRPKVRHSTLAEAFGVELMRVTAFREGRWPNVP